MKHCSGISIQKACNETTCRCTPQASDWQGAQAASGMQACSMTWESPNIDLNTATDYWLDLLPIFINGWQWEWVSEVFPPLLLTGAHHHRQRRLKRLPQAANRRSGRWPVRSLRLHPARLPHQVLSRTPLPLPHLLPHSLRSTLWCAMLKMPFCLLHRPLMIQQACIFRLIWVSRMYFIFKSKDSKVRLIRLN